MTAPPSSLGPPWPPAPPASGALARSCVQYAKYHRVMCPPGEGIAQGNPGSLEDPHHLHHRVLGHPYSRFHIRRHCLCFWRPCYLGRIPAHHRNYPSARSCSWSPSNSHSLLSLETSGESATSCWILRSMYHRDPTRWRVGDSGIGLTTTVARRVACAPAITISTTHTIALTRAIREMDVGTIVQGTKEIPLHGSPRVMTSVTGSELHKALLLPPPSPVPWPSPSPPPTWQ